MRATVLALTLTVLAVQMPASGSESLPAPRKLASPAAAGSAQPQLAVAATGAVYLSWLEKTGENSHKFLFSTLPSGSDTWTTPVVIHEGSGFFANWADVPSLSVTEDGMLAAHWLQVSGAEKYAYDVRVRVSRDGGRTWGAPYRAHQDATPAEHGFASFFPWPGGGLGLAWLDGRTHGQMSLRAARITSEGPAGEVLVDNRVCDCCPTSAVQTSRGIALAYRDRSGDEIRDIYVARFEGGRWLEGRVAVPDKWQIAACPVNGPSLSAAGDRVALGWFAAPDGTGRVQLAVSSDGAATFGKPVRIDDGNPLGRVDAELLEDGSTLVGWIEQLESGAEFRVRRVAGDGSRGAALAVAPLAAGRSSGYPRIARSGSSRLVFAWVGAEGVQTSVAELGQ